MPLQDNTANKLNTSCKIARSVKEMLPFKGSVPLRPGKKKSENSKIKFSGHCLVSMCSSMF